jgi:hypothetical protein
MRVEAFLADSVTNAEGKLYVLGAGWSLLNTQALPFVQDRIGIGLIFRVAYAETNQIHRFEVYLVDADGHELQFARSVEDRGFTTAQSAAWVVNSMSVDRPTFSPATSS